MSLNLSQGAMDWLVNMLDIPPAARHSGMDTRMTTLDKRLVKNGSGQPRDEPIQETTLIWGYCRRGQYAISNGKILPQNYLNHGQ